MKSWKRICSFLLAAALVFGLVPTVLPSTVEAAVPTGVHNNLPTTAEDIVYLSDMAWEYSENYNDTTNFLSRGYYAVRDGAWRSGSIVLGRTSTSAASFDNTTFTKGLGMMPKNISTDVNDVRTNVAYTVFDLEDNNYEQSFFYSAAGLTNASALTNGNGVVFEVWGSYDQTGTAYNSAEYVLLESSGSVDNGTYVTADYVYQFHVDITGVRYLKLVVYGVTSISGMNAAWGGACVYNNPGYYPKSDLMGLNDTTDNNTWVPTGTTPHHTYHMGDIPAGATYLSGSAYKDTSGGTAIAGMSTLYSASSDFGTSSYWIGGETETFYSSSNTSYNSKDGLLATVSKYVQFNAKSATAAGYAIFDISGLNANRFYTVVGLRNQQSVHTKLNADSNTYAGMVCEIYGATEETGTYTKLAESEPIMLSNVGEFIVDITGYNYLKLQVKTKDDTKHNALDVMFYLPCVYYDTDVTVDGDRSVLRGTTGSYTAAVTDGDGTETVTWDVSGANSESTAISADGVLTVGSDETAGGVAVTATINGVVSEAFYVATRRVAQDFYNQLPATATDVKYLSNMTYEYSDNYADEKFATRGYHAVMDQAWRSGTIVLGDSLVKGGTAFIKGMGVMPKSNDSSPDVASQTVFDLADTEYAHNYFYSAVGITNAGARDTGGTVTNGVYFAVYGSYDKDVEYYSAAEYALLETSDKVTQGDVYQFHVDVTGVRYLKLVVYTAQESIASTNCAWGGACLYNNEGYYPKTDMIGDGENGAYIAYEDRDDDYIATNSAMFNALENNFNVYRFQELPYNAVMLADMARTQTYTPGVNIIDNRWFGGTDGSTSYEKDGLLLPAGTSPNFKNNVADEDGVAEGYLVYDVSELGVNTFYAMVGVVENGFKNAVYARDTGNYGGVGFQVWGTYEEDGEYRLLSASEIIHRSNTGEFIVDITGVKLLKIRHYQLDPRSVQVHGLFGYASVFAVPGVTVSGATSVEQGAAEPYTAQVGNGLDTAVPDVTWTVSGNASTATAVDANGVLTVGSNETATEITVTASVEVDGVTVTDSVTVTVASAASGLLNHRPTTATDVKHLSNMTWEYSVNNGNKVARKDRNWNNTNPNVMGDIADNGGVSTTFYKGIAMQPDATMDASHDGASHTVWDLADNGYKQQYFYACAGITNDAAKSSTSTSNVTRGVYFAVYGSYDKSVEDYSQAEYVLLEQSDLITNGKVHQFHVDVTGVRYLKLVVYAAQSSISNMDCAWAGACLYNNSYIPKTEMLGNCYLDQGYYVAPETPGMYNTYHYMNLPSGATLLTSLTPAEYAAHVDTDGNSTFTNVTTAANGVWIGGTHNAVTEVSTGELQDVDWQKDGVKFSNAVVFNVRAPGDSDNLTDGYAIYDVTGLGDTFYAVVGAANQLYKYSDYDYLDTHGYGGMVFEVWGATAQDGTYTLLAASEPILKSNSGELLVDITGYNYLKLRIRAQDTATNSSCTGAFAYASVYNETWDVSVSGSGAVVKGKTASLTAAPTRSLIPSDYYIYPGDVTWALSGANDESTCVEDGVVTVSSDESAESVNVTAAITESGSTYTSDDFTLTLVDRLAYVGENGYNSLYAAVNKAASIDGGGTVEIKADAAFAIDMTITENVTIDCGTHTVTGAEHLNLGEGAELTVTAGGGAFEGRLELVGEDVVLKSDVPVALELNGYDATVTADNVTLTDCATDDGTEGGKVYGDITLASRVTNTGSVKYVVLDGSDDTGNYVTANAVRVKITRVSVRPSVAGIYYSSSLSFNKNVASVSGVSYGVAVSVADKPVADFATDGDSLYTKLTPASGADFSRTGYSCLVENILSSENDAGTNAENGAMSIYVNGYVKLTVDGEEIVILAENDSTVKYSMKSIMTAMDTAYKTDLQAVASDPDTYDSWTGSARKLYDFYETWEPAMRSWSLSNLLAVYERNIEDSHLVVASDILGRQIIVTDLNATDALSNPTWTWQPTTAQGWSFTTDDITLISEVKYRYHDQLKKNVILFCDGYGDIGMIDYSSGNEGKKLWEATGSNSPHGLELLPGGDIVLASSGGGTRENGKLYYYNWTGSTYTLQSTTYALNGAHSVNWDGEYLWVTGYYGLYKYSINTSSNTLTQVEQVWTTGNYAHDVATDYTDSNYLWVTDNNGVYRIKKSDGSVDATVKNGGVKSTASFADGVMAWASYSDAPESTNDEDTHPTAIRLFKTKLNGDRVQYSKLTDTSYGFNKVRALNADYTPAS